MVHHVYRNSLGPSSYCTYHCPATAHMQVETTTLLALNESDFILLYNIRTIPLGLIFASLCHTPT